MASKLLSLSWRERCRSQWLNNLRATFPNFNSQRNQAIEPALVWPKLPATSLVLTTGDATGRGASPFGPGPCEGRGQSGALLAKSCHCPVCRDILPEGAAGACLPCAALELAHFKWEDPHELLIFETFRKIGLQAGGNGLIFRASLRRVAHYTKIGGKRIQTLIVRGPAAQRGKQAKPGLVARRILIPRAPHNGRLPSGNPSYQSPAMTALRCAEL
jgi:hypothetical protein